MTKNTFFLISLLVSVALAAPAAAFTAAVHGPDIKIRDNNIVVDTGLKNLREIETELSSGIEREIMFTIELIRAWAFWPDEFVASRKIQRIIKYDNLRGQYFVSSNDGTTRIEKKFRDLNDSVRDWIFMLRDITLANTKELEPAKYYVRVIIESRSREVPKVIGMLMLFIPEVEMSLAEESRTFTVSQTTHEKP
ncbi:MAG: DUF4390 domain-containing protein [Nitrospirae bacterium]|nr:DUF4390 domain-containing protein [Nitrospirota bacterium]